MRIADGGPKSRFGISGGEKHETLARSAPRSSSPTSRRFRRQRGPAWQSRSGGWC